MVTLAGGKAASKWCPFSACARVPNATRLDVLRRPGIGAVLCRIGPGLQFAVLSDETVSWPVILGGGGSAVSLEDPVAKRAWFPNASPVRIRPGRERFLAMLGADRLPAALVYSGFVSRTDGPGSVNVFVALRLRPQPCLLGVTRDPSAALRLARDASASCILPFGRG
jgi:hypothetical protein